MRMEPTKGTSAERLNKERMRLIDEFERHSDFDFPERHTKIVDTYLMEAYSKSIQDYSVDQDKNPYTIIALGGYGRKELCVHSDIDLLFLFKKRIPGDIESIMRDIVYPLWDIGFEVSPTVRVLEDAFGNDLQDIETFTAYLDARYVCGKYFLYSSFREKFRTRVIINRIDDYVNLLIESNMDRHQRFGDSSYLLEPNLKEGQGGLRDYHTMLWIARLKSNLLEPRDMEYEGYISYDEFQELSEALSFIWYVRNHLHLIVGRKYDQLRFAYQEKIAKKLQYKSRTQQHPVEIFLGQLHGQMYFIKQMHLMFIKELETAKIENREYSPEKAILIDGLEIKRGMLHFISPKWIIKAPELLIQIFEESANMEIPLSAEAKRLIKHFVYLINDRFRSNPEIIRSFESVLLAPTPDLMILNDMLSTGFLMRFIPEFKGIVDQIQFDMYHLYPVDKHSIYTVYTLKRFARENQDSIDEFMRGLYLSLSDGNRKCLLWSALFHDIGKSRLGENHSETGAKMIREILSGMNFHPDEIETISFLIEKHLFLAETAARRDVRDEETAITCAKIIKDIDRLNMLYLLTVADSISTGPKAWNNWTSVLIKELYANVLSILERGELASEESVEIVENKRMTIVSSSLDPRRQKDLETIFNFMSPRYLLYTPVSEILEHIRLYESLDDNEFVLEITGNEGSNIRTATICAKDRPGLLSKIAGAFLLNGVSILDIKIFTWRNNTALDVFKIKAPLDPFYEQDKWHRIENDLDAALSERLDLSKAIHEIDDTYMLPVIPGSYFKSNKIVVDNDSSSFFTIIEVYSYDVQGLLYRITDALFRSKLNVWTARTAHKVDQIVFIFYVRDLDEQKIYSQQMIGEVKKNIGSVLPTMSR